MTVEEANELSRLAGLWATARVRRYAVMYNGPTSTETTGSVNERERRANAEFHEYLRSLIYNIPQAPQAQQAA